MQTWQLAIAGGLIVALTGACGDSENVCTPGATQVCVCPAGKQGAQSCLDTGKGWNRCECGTSPDAAPIDMRAGDGPGPGDGAPPDAPVPDVPAPDAPLPDGQPADTTKPDSAPDIPSQLDVQVDVALSDAVPLDKALPDKALPDKAVPDQAVPDAAPPDQAMLDAAPPDQALPDLPMPDTSPCDCNIAGTCYASEAINPSNKCQKCHPSTSVSAWTLFPAPGCIITLAGDGQAGLANGSASAARFNGPVGVAVDTAGAVYVADRLNYVIRRIANGLVTTVAGVGTAGFADGPAAASKFGEPNGICVGLGGKVYVSDTINYRIRLIDGGVVSTIAGDGTVGFSDGPALSSKIGTAYGCATESTGFYYADYGSNRVRAVFGGLLSTFAGDGIPGLVNGSASIARFKGPIAVAADGAGKVYVAESLNHTVRQIVSGVVSTLAGDGTAGFADGPATTARFNTPWGVAVDGTGKVYVSDSGNSRIRVISGGAVTTLVGASGAGFADGPLATAKINGPRGLAVDASGNIYVSDLNNQRIRMIVP